MEISTDAIERSAIGGFFAALLAGFYGLFTMRDKVNRHEEIIKAIPHMQATIEKTAKDVAFMRGRWKDEREDDN